MRVALLLAPLFEGATPGDPFAWFHSDALPMPGETICQGGVVWQVAMRAFTVNDENPGIMAQTPQALGADRRCAVREADE